MRFANSIRLLACLVATSISAGAADATNELKIRKAADLADIRAGDAKPFQIEVSFKAQTNIPVAGRLVGSGPPRTAGGRRLPWAIFGNCKCGRATHSTPAAISPLRPFVLTSSGDYSRCFL